MTFQQEGSSDDSRSGVKRGRSSSPELTAEMTLQLEESSDKPRSGTEISPSPELGAGSADATPNKKAKRSRKKSKKGDNCTLIEKLPANTGKGKVIDDSQPNTELDDMQEKEIITGDEELDEDEELDSDTRFTDRDGDASYAGQISNPAGLSYSVTSRLLPGSSVTLEFAKDQHLHITVEKDPEGSDQDSGHAGKLNAYPTLAEIEADVSVVQLALFVANTARMRKLSGTWLAQRERQTRPQTQGTDNKGSQIRAQDVPEVSEERSLSQERQATQADTEVGEGGAGALPKSDGMDLDSEIDWAEDL